MRREILLVVTGCFVVGCTKFQNPVDAGGGGTGGPIGSQDASGAGGTGGSPTAQQDAANESAGSTDASAPDGPPDAVCTCPGGFACSAGGACKTTCATSIDCAPDYFCDPSNGRCHSDVVSVAGGADQTCVALRDGRTLCWGANDMGQLGIGMTGASSADPLAVLGLSNVRLLKASEHDTCAVTLEGRLYCWGSGAFGGTGHVDPAPVPIRDASGTTLSNVTLLNLTNTEACAVTTSAAYCWTGYGTSSTGFPTVVGGAAAPSSMVITNYFHAVSYGDARVCPWASGENPQGQCFSTGSNVAELTSNDITAFARLTTGVVVSWGSNAFGFLGSGVNDTTLSDASPPGVIVSNLNAGRVVGSYTTICAIPTTDRRSIACWGTLGSANVSTPTKVTIALPPGLEITDLGSGIHSLTVYAIVSDGSLQALLPAGGFSPVSATW